MNEVRKKFYFYSFGCQMNEHDTARMAQILRTCGYSEAFHVDEADVIIINTCSVRRNPENKVYSLLGQLRALKRRKPDLIIGVAGCVAQQEGSKILQREKSVDMVFGPDHYFSLPEMLERVSQGEKVLLTEWDSKENFSTRNFIPEKWLEYGHFEGCKSYIAIMKGCNNFCSFCIVPYTRGRETCREAQNILKEVCGAIKKGAKEIWLLGQNVNSYRAGDVDFYRLLEMVSSIDEVLRIRFTSPHPKDWDERLTHLMASKKNICNHLHLPLQSGSNRILHLMNRKHTIETYLEKINTLKKAIPGVEISTDIIVGFPTETEEDFDATLNVLKEIRFSQVFSFKYSPRPGTMAATFEDDVPREVKEERLQRLITLQESINQEQMRSLIGSVHEVLIDSVHHKLSTVRNGRTEGYRPVKVDAPELQIGDLVKVEIIGFENHWLEGKLV